MTAKQRKARNAYERERRRLHRLHRFEYAARERGFMLVGGVDEVGRGPLAGPVVAACVVAAQPLFIKGLNDSKLVRADVRVAIADEIRQRATAWALGSACVAEIDRLNIYWASVLAMERAIASLPARAAISDHRRGANPIVRRPARATDPWRRPVCGRRRRVDLGEGPSRRPHGRARPGRPAVRLCAPQGLLHAAAHRVAARARTERAPSGELGSRARRAARPGAGQRRGFGGVGWIAALRARRARTAPPRS